MARRALSQSDYDALEVACWRTVEHISCRCWVGRPCARSQAFGDLISGLLGSRGTDGRQTVERWAGWRTAPGGFRLALGEPLEDR